MLVGLEDSTAPYVLIGVARAKNVNEIWFFVGGLKRDGDYSPGSPDNMRTSNPSA